MTSYSSFRGLGKYTRACQTGFLDSTQNKSEVKKSVWLTGVSLPNPLNDGALTSLNYRFSSISFLVRIIAIFMHSDPTRDHNIHAGKES